MTQPDQTVPTGVLSASGLAALAAKTQEDWETEINSPIQNSINDVLSGFWGDLPNGGAFGLTLVTEIVRQLIGDPEAIFTSITDALSSIGQWALDLITGGISVILQTFETFLSSIPGLDTWLGVFKTLIDALLDIPGLSTFLDVFKVLINALTGIFDFEAWMGVFTQVIDFFNTISDGVRAAFLTAMKTVIDFFSGLIGEHGSLDDWLAQLPIIGDLLNLIRTITGINAIETLEQGITELITWTQKIPVVGSLVGSILNGWKNPTTGTGNTLADLVAYAGKLLTDESVVPTINLFGILPPDLTALIPVGHVGDASPNLVTEEAFSAEATIQAGGGWSWDGTTNNTGSAGGSAKVVGDGGVKQLLSNMVQVAKDQTLDLSTSVKWTKGSSTTPTFLIGLRGYNSSGSMTFTTTFASVTAKSGYTSPSSTAAYTVGAGTTATLSSGWVKISGKSTAIPAGTTQVRMLLGTTNGPSGTTAWFDDATMKKTQKLAQELINGLLDALGLKLPTLDYQALLDKITNQANSTLQQVANTLAGFLTGSSALNGSNILSGDIDSAFISDLVNTWVKAVFGLGGQTTSGNPDDLSQKLSDLTVAVKSQTTEIQKNTQQIANLLTRVGNLETGQTATPNGVLARLTKLEQTANFSTVTPPSSGPTLVSVFDSFDGRTTMGGNWVVYETFNNGNSLSIPNSQDAQYVCPQFNSSTQQVMAIWNGTGKASSTKFQKIFAVFGSAAGIPAAGSMGFNDFIGLANPALPTQGIIWRIYANGTSKVFYRTSGLESDPWNPSNLLGSFSAPINTATGKPIQPTTSTPVELYIGDKAGVLGSSSNNNVLYATISGARIGSVPIGSSVLSLMGSANGWGFGMGQGLSSGLFGLGASQTPATLATWGAQDQ